MRIIVALLCAALFTAYFTIYGASSYFETYLTFSTIIYVVLGIPASIFIDNVVKKKFNGYSSTAKTVLSFLLYVVGGMLITLILISTLGNKDIFYMLYLLALGAVAGFVFFTFNFLFNRNSMNLR